MRPLVLPKLYCLLMTHLNRWNGRLYLSCWSPYFGFFMCSCYSRKMHYTVLEKPSVQNVATNENQGKQQNSSDCWITIKMLFKKKITTEDGAKKTKRLTKIKLLTKDLISYKIRFIISMEIYYILYLIIICYISMVVYII